MKALHNTLFFLCLFSSIASAQTQVSYTYDELGRVTSATDTVNGKRNFTYDPAGNRTLVKVDPLTNTAPKAVNDYVTVKLYTTVYVNVLGNDSDPDGDALSVASYGSCSVASITRNGSGLNITATYAPSSCSFTYIISDGKGGQSSATVFVTTN